MNNNQPNNQVQNQQLINKKQIHQQTAIFIHKKTRPQTKKNKTRSIQSDKAKDLIIKTNPFIHSNANGLKTKATLCWAAGGDRPKPVLQRATGQNFQSASGVRETWLSRPFRHCQSGGLVLRGGAFLGPMSYMVAHCRQNCNLQASSGPVSLHSPEFGSTMRMS